MLLRSRAVARSAVELAKSEVAVGLERAHAEFVGQREGLAVVTFRRRDIRSIGTGSDLAKEAKSPSLVAALPTLSSKCEGSTGEFERVIEPVGEQARLAHVRDDQRLELVVGPLTLVQQREAFGNTPRYRVRRAQKYAPSCPWTIPSSNAPCSVEIRAHLEPKIL